MGSEQNQGTSFPPSESILCANGCGFFGTAANMNLCSKCYRDLRVQEEHAASAKAAMEKTFIIKPKQDLVIADNVPDLLVAPNPSDAAVASELLSAAEPLVAGGDQAPLKAANRCYSCNKRVGLTGFKCKCGRTYCGNHRYPENHDCSFDFKGEGRNAIAKANPVVKADKMERI